MTQPLPADGYGLLPVTEVPLDLLHEFACGKPHLDEFLHEDAGLTRRKKTSRDRVGMDAARCQRNC
jgi:hypothetical protein